MRELAVQSIELDVLVLSGICVSLRRVGRMTSVAYRDRHLACTVVPFENWSISVNVQASVESQDDAEEGDRGYGKETLELNWMRTRCKVADGTKRLQD